MSDILSASGIVAGYGDVHIVTDVSIRLEPGGSVAIVGPNGSGKSTLLKSLLGFARLFEGKIMLDGRDITGFSSDKTVALGLGYVPQTDNVFANLTVQENLEMGAFVRRDGASIKRDIARMYELFPELERRRKFYAGSLSGGERQMLAIGRALMAKPRLLMLDEPSLGLAPLIVREVLQMVASLRKLGVSVLLVEQNARAALQVADRAYVLEMGTVALSGTAQALMHDRRIIDTYLGIGRKGDPLLAVA